LNAPLPIGLLFRFMTSIPSQEADKPRRPVVSALLRRKGRILILRRSDKVGSFQGYWSCVSGYVERGEDPLDTAIREIEEEVGIPPDRASLVRRCGPNLAETEQVIFESHWFLFDCDQKEIRLDWEHEEFAWADPSRLEAYKLVPWFGDLLTQLMVED